MKKSLRLALLVFPFLFLAACAASPCQPVTLPQQSFDPAIIKSVSVNVDGGNVVLTGNSKNAIVISGSQACAKESTLQIGSANGVLTITSTSQRHLFQNPTDSQVKISIQAPAGVPVQITTDDATTSISQYDGTLKVDSVAGDITALVLAGEAQLRSGRGDVTLKDSHGVFHVLGEHGILDIESSHGSIDSSTIMGTIQYQGAPEEGDTVHFEVDHGPVEITLGENSDLNMTATSTSGDVACMVPGITQNGRGCAGVLGKGSASFYVRTVSGAITIQ